MRPHVAPCDRLDARHETLRFAIRLQIRRHRTVERPAARRWRRAFPYLSRSRPRLYDIASLSSFMLRLKLVTLPDHRMVDPVRRPREDLAVSRTLTVVALILVLAGCGGWDSESSDTSETTATVEATQTTTETTQTIMSSEPLACLEEAGLSDVEERDVGLWRGLHEDPAFAIVVHKLRKPAKAPIVVAGAYAVTRSFKVAAEGTGLHELGTRCRFSGARGRGLLRRLAPHFSPQRYGRCRCGFRSQCLCPVAPLYARVADSIFQRETTGLRVVSIFTK